MKFADQKILVTGATRGIGRAIALAFLRQGATVLGVYNANQAAGRILREEAASLAGNLVLYQCNVADSTQVDQLYGAIEQEYEVIDVLVSNAGIRRDALLALMKPEEWQQVIDVNLTGSFLMARQAVLLMLKKKYGRIIFITSPMAHIGFPGQGNYAASKAGQVGLMRCLAKEVAKKKITVNCVSPGFIDTELLADLPPEKLEEYKKAVPVRRFGKPEEVAAAVLFLAGSESSYITGAVLDVNGGI